MLNINQRKAVMTNNRFIFLLAGAGTGKTRVIVERTKRLIKEGANEEKIILFSFTRKSVQDLKYKLKNYNVFITTFHGFCYKILSQHIEIKIVDENKLINNGFSKDNLKNIEVYKRNGKRNNLTKKYNQYLKVNGLVDFNDLELMLYQKLKRDKIFKEKLIKRFQYIFVDEYQDTSTIQFLILKELVDKDTHFFAVGDPNQAIYGFRGASKRIITAYINTYKAAVLRLDLNYRSNTNIITAANKVIKYNRSSLTQKLYPYIRIKGIFEIKRFKSEEEQNEFILQKIRILLKDFKQQQIAFLYRNHYLSNSVRDYLFNTYFDRFNFLTIHQAKGLEFDIVFFIGLEEGNLPMTDINIKEERNLFYVGLTRARRQIYLCSVIKNKKPSRFIKECIK